MNRYFLIIFLTTIALACTKQEIDQNEMGGISQDDLKVLTIKKNREFILNAGDRRIGKIEAPVLIHEDKDGGKRMVFYDSGLNQIIISDSSGNVNSVFGRSGSGPMEFRHISSFGLDEDTVIVYDAVLDMVKKFNFDGDFLNSYKGLLEDKIWLRSNRLYSFDNNLFFGVQESGKSNESNHWLSKTVAVYDKGGNLQSLIGDYDPSLTNTGVLYNYANITMADDGTIYTTHRTSPWIQKFNIQGKRLSRFGILPKYFKISSERPHLTAPREVKNEINLTYSFVGDSFVSSEYFLFYYFNFTEEAFKLRNPNDLENYLQVYDRDDQYIGDIELPFYPVGFDQNNHLYLLENDNSDSLKIGVYEIKG